MRIRLKEETDFGTNGNENINKMYCHFCFQGETFTDDGITRKKKSQRTSKLQKIWHAGRRSEENCKRCNPDT
ncbi:zinc ribbon domain-containing protein [Methanohalophilus levihalophilus]|uniref:zinc ribbon domain-containing protein n=1 Tax=Methanohalophilus levihalophilus TaxID=1431282 RepID=UPI001AE8A49A